MLYVCQLVNQWATLKATLYLLALTEVGFERIGMDLIGPVHWSTWGYNFTQYAILPVQP